MKRGESYPDMRVEHNYLHYANPKKSYDCFYIFVCDDHIPELSRSELLLLRELIDRALDESENKKESDE